MGWPWCDGEVVSSPAVLMRDCWREDNQGRQRGHQSSNDKTEGWRTEREQQNKKRKERNRLVQIPQRGPLRRETLRRDLHPETSRHPHRPLSFGPAWGHHGGGMALPITLASPYRSGHPESHAKNNLYRTWKPGLELCYLGAK